MYLEVSDGSLESMHYATICLIKISAFFQGVRIPLKGGTGEISNFYNLSARLLIFDSHIPPIIVTRTSKFRSYLSDTFWIMIFSFLKKGLFSKSISSDKFKVYDLEFFFTISQIHLEKTTYPYLRNLF